MERIFNKIVRRERITPDEALELWNEAPLARLGALAFDIKHEKSGNSVFYNRNIHIEPTNICLFKCKFCSYRREEGDPQAWHHTIDDIARLAAERRGTDITEVHIVGGVHPQHSLGDYIDMVAAVRRELPEVTIKAFTAVELAYIIRKDGLSIEEGLRRLIDAGMGAIPGGGAEIFDPRLRARICPEKGSTEQWFEVHDTAHRLGLTTNATMLYGHVETPQHRIDHLDRLRRQQDTTGGFNAFIPLKFRARNNNMSSVGETSVVDDMRTLAMARIYLDNFPHIKAYWPMYGIETTEMALAFGADDVDGTIDNTTKIYSMAGADEPRMTVGQLQTIATRAGLNAVERDTFYNIMVND
jgi:aminodeoxyfutalosine synthase